jgi:hypothetical protein
MIDVGSVASGLSSIKAAKDIVEDLVGLRDAAKIQAVAVKEQNSRGLC